MCEKFHQLLAVGRWFPPGTPVSSTRKLISSSFHRLDMTLAVAEALTPNKPNQSLGTQIQGGYIKSRPLNWLMYPELQVAPFMYCINGRLEMMIDEERLQQIEKNYPLTRPKPTQAGYTRDHQKIISQRKKDRDGIVPGLSPLDSLCNRHKSWAGPLFPRPPVCVEGVFVAK